MSRHFSQGDSIEEEFDLLPKDWKIKKLGDLDTEKARNITPAHGETYEYYSIPAYQEFKKPVIVKGKTILSQKKILKEGMILFGKLNPRVEKVWKVKCYTPHEKIGSGEWLTILTNPSQVNPDYLYYLELSHYVMPIAQTYVTGSTPSRQRVDPSSFYNIKVPIPPLEEQTKIVFLLAIIEAALEKSESVIVSLNELRKSLMKYLFTYGAVDFVSAEKVKLKETDFGQMPEEWSLKELQQVGVFQYGYTETTSEKEIGPKFVRITDINLKNNRIKWASVPYCKISDKECPKYALNEEDILIARIGATTGKTCIIKKPPKSVFASYLIRFTSRNASSPFVYYFTLSELYWKQVAANKEGKLKKGVSSSQLKKFLIPVPPLQEQKEIASILSSVDSKIECEEKKKKPLMNYSNQCFLT